MKQYALTKEAFDFWTILKKNTQQVGGIFDALPSELTGNIHCVTNPQEIVIGFVSAGTVTKKRIFIGYEDIAPWQKASLPNNCSRIPMSYNKDIIDYYFGRYAALYTPLDALNLYDGTYANIERAEIHCADCREKGGTNKKPSYWP